MLLMVPWLQAELGLAISGTPRATPLMSASPALTTRLVFYTSLPFAIQHPAPENLCSSLDSKQGGIAANSRRVVPLAGLGVAGIIHAGSSWIGLTT